MSDEAAFLAALRANPADDLTRLVYADWLDEHGETAKAEYLRLVVEIAQCDGNLATAPGSERFVGLAVALSTEWRSAVGSRFAVVLDDFRDVIKTIKWLRELTGCTLGEARAAVESAPRTLLHEMPFEYASAACESIRDSAKVRITSGTSDSP
jgi:uncharacterized protein (TIGR02996 family)